MKLLTVAVTCLIMTTACSLRHIQASSVALNPESVPVELGPGTIGSNGPMVGVNLYALHNYTPAQTEEDGERTLSYIENNLHADAVDIVWNMYAPGDQSNSVVTTKNTLTAGNVGILTQIALRLHLQVEYRPLMFILAKHDWEGLINPSSPAAWFNNYYAKNVPYLRVAQKYHVSEYVIGTEMIGLGGDKQWASLLSKSAKIYRGQISYAAHQSQYFPPARQSPSTELVGMDMYKALNLPATASLSKVVAAYEHFFVNVPADLLRRTAIQETGIEARAGAYSDPPNLTATGKLDEAVQYNWFIAACETVKRFHMRGVFFWKVDLSDYPVTHPASSLSTFEGKEGAVAISKCASILNS